jgi:hypothetical protein
VPVDRHWLVTGEIYRSKRKHRPPPIGGTNPYPMLAVSGKNPYLDSFRHLIAPPLGSGPLQDVPDAIKRRQVALFTRCDPEYGARVARRVLSDSSVAAGAPPVGLQDIAIP